MNEEIAIDPATAPGPRELSKLIRFAFGPFHGKYLSDFPKSDWWDAYAVRFAEADRYLIRELRSRRSLAWHFFGRRYDASSDWGTNAEKEHARHAFYALLSSKRIPGSFGSVDDEHFIERIAANTSGRRFDANNNSYIEFARVLLHRGPEVVICDPYLSKLDEHGRIDVLSSLLKETRETRCTDFTVVTQIQGNESAKAIMEKFKCVTDENSRACRFRVIILKRRGDGRVRDLHKRFLVTLSGGLEFDRGFEIPPKRKNSVTIMPMETHKDCVEEFITRRPTWSDIALKHEWAMPTGGKTSG